MVRRVFIILFSLLLVGYAIFVGLLFFFQDSLIFVPTTAPFAVLETKAKKEGFEPWVNARGERIGWQSIRGNPDKVILVFNGQGGHALKVSFIGECCRTAGQWKTFLLEYPGYGSRPGIPSEKSLVAAGLEAVDLLLKPGRKIWLAGQSLGSGTACAVIHERGSHIAGLLLLTPFYSLVEEASHRYPFVPVSALLRTRFESAGNLLGYPGPVAIFLSGRDTVIPKAQGEKLYATYQGRKRLWIDPESNHDVSRLLLRKWPEIIAWLQAAP